MVLEIRTVFIICSVMFIPVRMERVKRSDDMDLQAVVQQQSTALADLEAKVTALSQLAADVTELKSKMTTISAAVAFTCMFSTDNGNDGMTLGAHNTLQFDKVITNVGNGYDHISGEFTAPVSGVYAFYTKVMSPDLHHQVGLAIVKEGSPIGMAWAPYTTDNNDQGSTHVTTTLTAGQRVWVRLDSGDAVRGSYWTVFTGYLLQAQ